MTAGIAVHQLVHGYVHGHSLLIGSIELQRQDADLIARLSDLSGTLGPDLDPTPYLSLYPLPSGKFYAVAKTWPDGTAPRAGCVLTHTLLVPSTIWANATRPQQVSSLLRQPDREQLKSFSAPLSFPNEVDSDQAIAEPFGISFVQKYFGEGLRPLAWFGAKDPDQSAWSIMRCMWPKLRVSFACCTYALQPRTLDDRPFDLAFAPTLAFSRFSEFPRAHVIDARTLPELKYSDTWLQAWCSEIFGGEAKGSSGQVLSLARELEAEPTAIRRVFFYIDLRGRAPTSATAAIGGLDVLETLAPNSETCVEDKRALVSVALRDVERMPPSESLELFYLLSERLAKPSLSSARDLANGLRRMVGNAIIAEPAEGIHRADDLTERQPETVPATFVAGVCDGVLEVLRRDRSALSIFLQHPALGDRLVRDCTGLAKATLSASTSSNHQQVVEMVLEWCRSQQADNVRASLRAELLPTISGKDDAPLVEELLRELTPSDVPTVCDIVAHVEAFDDDVLITTAASALSAAGASQLKEWAANRDWESPRVAALVAATYSADEKGVRHILDDYSSDVAKEQSVLAALIRRTSTYLLPVWLERLLATEPRIWAALFAAPSSSGIHDVVSRLVRRVRRSSIARMDDAPTTIGHFADVHRDDVIREHAVRQAWADFLEGDSTEEGLRNWMGKPWVAEWLSRAPRSVLRGEFANALSRSRSAWIRCWRLLADLPQSLCIENPAPAYDGIGFLLQRSETFESEAAQSWRSVLRPIAYGEKVQVDLCAQALSFALAHRYWPVDDIAAETFFAVHNIAMRDEPRERSFLFWTIRDWDKAKELRRSLVDAFRYGQWRPSRFVLAGREPWLIRKLCKRMLRQYRGETFLDTAYRELSNEASPSTTVALGTLRDILRASDYGDDWD